MVKDHTFPDFFWAPFPKCNKLCQFEIKTTLPFLLGWQAGDQPKGQESKPEKHQSK